MAKKEREIYTLELVILGNFNPVIINPFWLVNKGLIRESENNKPEILHSQISRFELDWLKVEVTQTRIDLKCKRESDFEILKDLVISLFSILKETPIKAFGINHLQHYSLRDTNEYTKFGYWLSPVNEFKDFLDNPKVLSVTYIEDFSLTKKNETFRLTISPSDLLNDRKSVVFNINHHIENENKNDSIEFMKNLNELWDYSFEKADKISNGIWDKVKF